MKNCHKCEASPSEVDLEGEFATCWVCKEPICPDCTRAQGCCGNHPALLLIDARGMDLDLAGADEGRNRNRLHKCCTAFHWDPRRSR